MRSDVESEGIVVHRCNLKRVRRAFLRQLAGKMAPRHPMTLRKLVRIDTHERVPEDMCIIGNMQQIKDLLSEYGYDEAMFKERFGAQRMDDA